MGVRSGPARLPWGLVLLAALARPTAAPTAEAPGRDWTVTLDADAIWHRATPAGVLVVGTRAGVIGLEGATGAQLWRIDGADAEATALDVLPNPPYGLLRTKTRDHDRIQRVLIDVRTGKTLWDSSTLGLMDAFLQLYLPSLDALLLSGRTATRDTMLMVDLATGRSLHPFAPPRGDVANTMLGAPLVFDTDSSFVIASDRRLMRFDLATGFTTWTSPALEPGRKEPCGIIPDVRTGNDVPERTDPRPLPPPASMTFSDDGRRIFALEGSTLHAIDARDGRDLWRGAPELCGRCIGVSEVAGGVLARTMPEVNGDDLLYMIDGTTGAVRWRYPPVPTNASSIFKSVMRANVTLSDPLVDGPDVCVVAGTSLVRLDLLTGASRKAGRTKVDEPGALIRLERADEGFLVVGQQDVDWLDAGGTSKRHVSFSAPGDMSMGMVMLATAALFNKAGTVRGRDSEIHFYGSYRPGMERLMRQFHATSVFDSLIFILADLDEDDFEGLALVAVDKRGGRTVGRMPVAREPRLEFDPANGWVFVADKKTVRGHRF